MRTLKCHWLKNYSIDSFSPCWLSSRVLFRRCIFICFHGDFVGPLDRFDLRPYFHFCTFDAFASWDQFVDEGILPSQRSDCFRQHWCNDPTENAKPQSRFLLGWTNHSVRRARSSAIAKNWSALHRATNTVAVAQAGNAASSMQLQLVGILGVLAVVAAVTVSVAVAVTSAETSTTTYLMISTTTTTGTGKKSSST